MVTTSNNQLLPLRDRITWTVSHLLIVAGIYLLLLLGGFYAEIEYQRLAARGDNNLPPPVAVAAPPTLPQNVGAAPVPEFVVPLLGSENSTITSSVPDIPETAVDSTVTRVAIPSIAIDWKVIEVGWEVQERDGGEVAVWEVAEYAVGHHKGSANPGENDNIVLAGHVGGYGMPFRDLFYVLPGDEVLVYSAGQQYRYVVQERLILDEIGVEPEQRAENARYIGPTDTEMLTLVTCWPLTGADKFHQRIIIRAVPDAASATDAPADISWVVR